METVELNPIQIAVGLGVAIIVGRGLTMIWKVPVPTQPAVDVPLTVYVVVTIGERIILLPITFPGLVVYVDAPDKATVELKPAQIAVGLGTAVIVGIGLTMTWK